MPLVTDRQLIMNGILLQHLFSLLQQLCTADNGIFIFLYGCCEHLFVSKLTNEYFTDKYFKTVSEWLNHTWQLASITC